MEGYLSPFVRLSGKTLEHVLKTAPLKITEEPSISTSGLTGTCPLQTERGSLITDRPPGRLSLAPSPSGSVHVNTVGVGGGLDLVSVFLSLLTEAEKLSGTGAAG